jgi:hypothetical protein
MPRLAIAALLAAVIGGSALAQTSTSTPPADTGEQIKDGAVKVGTAVKEGAVKVGETVKQGAIDLWESGKAAVSSGSTTFNKRRSARDQGKDPDTGSK